MNLNGPIEFARDIAFFNKLVLDRQRGIHRRCAKMLKDSIVGDGNPHPVTSAPGQPVQSGNLKGSWIDSFPEHLLWEIVTNVVYAPFIEEGMSPGGKRLVRRSEVGGFHSLKITKAAFPAVLRKAVEEEKAGW